MRPLAAGAPPPLYRTQLREQVTSVLAELDAFGGHVYNMRGPVMRRDLLPAARIYTLNESRNLASVAHDIGNYDAQLTLRVQVIVENGADPNAAERLDWLCWLAETAILAPLNGRRDLRRVDSIDTTIDLDVQGELRTAVATMDFSVAFAECFDVEFTDDLRSLRFKLDFIDPPADPNTGPPGTPPNVEGGYEGGYPGPDGRIEYAFEVRHSADEFEP